MKITTTSASTFVKKIGLLILLSTCLCACSKDGSLISEQEQPKPAENGNYYKLQRVDNFVVHSDDDNPLAVPPTVYYNLETQKIVSKELLKTNQWDLAFGGLYNSFLSGNNGDNPLNHGSGNNATGGILIVKKPFDQIVDVPEDAAFNTAADLVGTDSSGDFGQGTGWYLYDFYGTIRSDGRWEKQHVAYALPESRTVVLRMAKGDYAKIKMISCYKDIFLPELMMRTSPKMYYTFEYVVVPKGSTKFEIK